MIDTAIGMLNVPELEALVSLNVDLAERYRAIADDCDAEPQTRGTAEALAAWRRARARYFQEQCAETERVEAAREPDLCEGSFGGARPGERADQPASPGVRPQPDHNPLAQLAVPPSSVDAGTAWRVGLDHLHMGRIGCSRPGGTRSQFDHLT